MALFPPVSAQEGVVDVEDAIDGLKRDLGEVVDESLQHPPWLEFLQVAHDDDRDTGH
jgi:hypothetical protein